MKKYKNVPVPFSVSLNLFHLFAFAISFALISLFFQSQNQKKNLFISDITLFFLFDFVSFFAEFQGTKLCGQFGLFFRQGTIFERR